MKVIDRISSAMRFLTAQQRRALAPTPSEYAIADLAQRMGVRMPGSH